MTAPVIGISCSTLTIPGSRGVRRVALPEYYVACVREAGGLPMLLPNVAEDTAAAYLARLDGLLLSGGNDVDPALYGQEPHLKLGEVDDVRDRFEIALARGAHQAGMPLLAICRGVQVLNVAFGGTLIQDVPSLVDGAVCHEQRTLHTDAVSHGVTLERGTHLRSVVGRDRARVNSFHHQACDRIAEGFVVTARATDGVIEGIEEPEHPFCLGIQWHPERMPRNAVTRALFSGFVDASAKAAGLGTPAPARP